MKSARKFTSALVFSLPFVLGLGAFYAYWVYRNEWELTLAHPLLLLALPAALIATVLAYVVYRPLDAVPGRSGARLFVSRGGDLGRVSPGIRARLMNLPAGLRITSVLLIGVALARPQRVDAPESLELSGIDIVLVLDLSGSMEASDLQPTRLQAAKEVIDNFIAHRRTDRIGLVVFGREAFPALAPTLDYTALRQTVESMEIGVLSQEDHSGTAIGDGLGAALNYLRRSDAKSKVVVLLTDGANNAGHVDPNHAAEFASALSVKVFTILVGQSDRAPMVQGRDSFGRPRIEMVYAPMDPDLLSHISQETGGQFFRAVDRASLELAFHTILDRLERSHIADAGVRRAELFPWLIVPAAFLILLEIVLSSTWLRRFP